MVLSKPEKQIKNIYMDSGKLINSFEMEITIDHLIIYWSIFFIIAFSEFLSFSWHLQYGKFFSDFWYRYREVLEFWSNQSVLFGLLNQQNIFIFDYLWFKIILLLVRNANKKTPMNIKTNYGFIRKIPSSVFFVHTLTEISKFKTTFGGLRNIKSSFFTILIVLITILYCWNQI